MSLVGNRVTGISRISHSVEAPARQPKKSYGFAIFVSVGLLAIVLLIVILANAPAPLQESILSALIW
jgi:hypothetical protein